MTGVGMCGIFIPDFIDLPMKMEPIECSETSAISTQTQGKYPKENTLHLKHGESLKSRIQNYNFIIYFVLAEDR